MYWSELPGSEYLKRVFSSPPVVGSIDVHSIKFDRDASSVIILFDLDGPLPDRVPIKSGEFNRCRLGINCAEIRDLVLRGWDSKNRGHLTIEKEEVNEYKITFISSGTHFEFSSNQVWVIGPSVYLAEE